MFCDLLLPEFFIFGKTFLFVPCLALLYHGTMFGIVVPQEACKKNGFDYNLPGVVSFIAQSLNLDHKAVFEDFVVAQHRAVNEQLSVQAVQEFTNNNSINNNNTNKNNTNNNNSSLNNVKPRQKIEFLKALASPASGERQQEMECARVMNTLDVAGFCVATNSSFALYPKLTQLFDRCADRLQMQERGILENGHSSQASFGVLSEFLYDQSRKEKHEWLNNKARYTSAAFDCNTTRKQPVITTVIKCVFCFESNFFFWRSLSLVFLFFVYVCFLR